MSSILKNLEFATQQPPKNSTMRGSTTDVARAKFLTSLSAQMKCVEAHLAGETEFAITKKRYMKQGDGKRVLTDKAVKVKPWWFAEGNTFFISPRYANKTLELVKGKPSILCGNKLAGVLTVLKSLRDAASNGELDKVLEVSAVATRERMKKKS
jgi:hypothetical protein